MKTEQTINSTILSAYLLLIIQRLMIQKRKKSLVVKILKKLKSLLLFGMVAKKAENGTSCTGKSIAKIKLLKRQLVKIAKIALKNILQQKRHETLVNSAGTTAKLVRCVSVEEWKKQPVYCLTEPKTSTFTIEGGLIVHNCD